MDAAVAILTLAAVHGGDLSTPLRASTRPSICAVAASQPGAVSTAPSSWDALRARELQALCLELARAQVRLATDPLAVSSRARELAEQWPGRAEPWLLQARARVRLGEYAEAWQAFSAARERGDELRAAHAARDYALTAHMIGDAESALATYRRLIPLAALWPDPKLAQRLYLEAAAAALALDADGISEALGYLAAVRPRATSTGLRTFAAGLAALAAFRRGQPQSELERVDSAEVWHFVEQLRSDARPRHWPVIPRFEIQAAASLLVERYSASEAAELWSPYVDALVRAGADALRIAQAQARLQRLTRTSKGS